MPDNASLSDYLFQLRRDVPPSRLAILAGAGTTIAIAGALYGPNYTWLAGLGMIVGGACAWAWINHTADSMDVSYSAEPSKRARQVRIAGIFALAVAAVGMMLLLSSFAMRFVLLTKGM